MIARALLVLAMAALAPGCATAQASWPAPVASDDVPVMQEPAAPIVIGRTHAIEYAPGDMRQVNVFLPVGYDQGDDRFPVLYLLDGGMEQDFLHVAGTTALNALWGRSQSVIVVGIETKDRRAELIGTKGGAEEQQEFPTAGNAAVFRAFIADKVKPMIDRQYRTSENDAVMGESLAGLFIVETWLHQPSLFDAYAAINPSLWWQDQALARSAQDTLADGATRGPILLSFSNEGPITQSAIEMTAKAAGSKACLLATGDLTHATAYHILTPRVLQHLFPTDYEADPEWGFEVGCAS
jgi:predicted alpha/beta superfamily hydrolase